MSLKKTVAIELQMIFLTVCNECFGERKVLNPDKVSADNVINAAKYLSKEGAATLKKTQDTKWLDICGELYLNNKSYSNWA